MQPVLSFNVTDAETGKVVRLVVTPDAHGLTVSVDHKGVTQGIVLDMSGNALRCYITNTNGEVNDDPVGQIEVPR